MTTMTAFALPDSSVAVERTFLYNATTTASTAEQLPTALESPSVQFRVRNTGNHTCYFAVGSADTLVATIPAVGTPGNTVGIPPGGVEIFTAPGNSYWSFVTSGGATDIEITAGVGI